MAAVPGAAVPALGRDSASAYAAGDIRLVAGVRSGDQRAFELIYARYRPALLSYCRRLLGSPEDAEDVLQQTFVKAYGALVTGRGAIALRPWLYTIARNECISALRTSERHARDPAEAHPAEAPEAAATDVAASVQQREDLRAMLADLQRLPRQQRDALLLTSFGAFGGEQIAKLLECESEKVKSLVFRARRSLRASREAREASCAEVRAQLAVLRRGALRRKVLREHLLECEGCREFRLGLRRPGRRRARDSRMTPDRFRPGASRAALMSVARLKAGGDSNRINRQRERVR